MVEKSEGASSGDDAAAYRFLCGADMEPIAILAAYPGARFVARARLATEATPDEVWGILIRVPPDTPTDQTAAPRQVVTDDGRRFPALAAHDGRPTGDPAAVLAAARYWELPPAYVRRLPRPPLSETE